MAATPRDGYPRVEPRARCRRGPDGVARSPNVTYGWPPTGKGFFGLWHVRSLAVMCPACCRGTWPLALMGSVDRTLIVTSGSRGPLTLDRFRSIRRLTDNAITRFHPRKSSGPAPRRPAVLVSSGSAGMASSLPIFTYMVSTLGGHDAELRHQAGQRVHRHGALLHEQFAGLVG